MSPKSDNVPWLTNEFVQKLLENSENDKNVLLESFQGQNACLDGENFSSLMFRLEVKFKCNEVLKHKMFIIKKAHESKDFQKISEETAIIEKEIEVYTKILPEVETLLKLAGQQC